MTDEEIRKSLADQPVQRVPGRPITSEELVNWFTYHPPTSPQTVKYVTLREAALQFAFLIRDVTPVSPEQSNAIRCLREAVTWANAAIACNEHG